MSDPPFSFELSGAESRLVDALLEAAHEASREGLLVSTSGNISARLDERRLAISAARARLGQLRRDEIVVASIDDPAAGLPSLESALPRPSRETALHRAIYRTSAAASVLHFQSLAATALACRPGALPELSVIPEIPVHVRKIGDVPYLPPGSEELARAVGEVCRDPEVRLVQLRSHGQVSIGETPHQAVERAAFFELACRIVLLSETRMPPRRFTPEELRLLAFY
jgi:ribulose-5-phosphate 4-epimerase/fuculose-1-phosphate aldolase